MIADRSGNMPFAVIAVTILLLSTAAASMLADYERNEDGISDTENGTVALQRSLDSISSYIDQELGVIILDISKDGTLGTLDERALVFESRADSWLEWHFPMSSGGITAELVSHDLSLTAESMEMIGAEGPVGGYVPAYLHGEGSVTVRVSSFFGGSTRDLSVSTDGSYALPLACEQGSLFERMVEGGGISLSQMISYQLESLAQYRVLNGYGARSEYGSTGTDAIITAEDVRRAYENSLDVIEAICFRDPDGRISSDRVDLADLLAGDIRIDRAAFYGQCLLSALDDMAVKWYDYLCGSRVFDRFDHKISVDRLLMDCIIGFFTGDDAFSAERYISEVMADNGVEPDQYRWPGSGTTVLTVGGYPISVDNPVKDLFEQKWVRYFNVHYELDRNYIQDSLRWLLNDAALGIMENDYGTLNLHIDPYDGTSFVESVTDAFRELSEECIEVLDDALLDSISSVSYTDPFYAAIVDTVLQHAEDMADCEAMRDAIAEELGKVAGDDWESLMGSREVEQAIHSYRAKVHSDLSVFDVLRHIDGNGPNMLLDILSDLVGHGLMSLGITSDVEERSSVILDEILANSTINPYSGVISLPSADYFVLVDGAGNRTRERMSFSMTSDPIFQEPVVVNGKCTHMTGFREDVSAGYSTTFQIRIDDCIDYSVETNSTLSAALGGSLTSSSMGSVSNDMVIEISVMSGWALAGVTYSASNTILSDIWSVLSVYLEPIMEPLRKIMEIVRKIIDELNSYLMEIARYVSDVLTDMYERIVGPLQEIADWIDSHLSEMLGDGVLEFFYRLNLNEQDIGFEYMGYTFTMRFDLASMASTVKTLFIATLKGPVADLDVEVSVTAKAKGELNSSNVFLTGKATVTAEDWKFKLALDPLMKGSKHLLTISAKIRNVDVSAVIPDIDDYHEIGVTLSRVPGIGQMLSSIPVPGLGVNLGLDAGLSLKYSAPVGTGLMINEFESNPKGEDNGNEWVELLNNTGSEITLDGYKLIASSDRNRKVMELSGSISPGEFLIIETTFLLVNSNGKLTKNGEALTLKDPDGVVVDKTATFKDVSDDSNSWQRMYDGSGEWEFKEATMGRSNGNYVSSKLLTVDVAKEIVWDAVQKSFDTVGSITDLDSMQEIVKQTVKNSIDSLIKRVAGCLVEASVFVKVDILDPTSTASSGIRIALRCDSDLVEDVLKFIAGKIEAMALSMKNPYKIDGVAMFADNIDLEVTFDTRIQYPGILARALEETPKVELGVTFRTNISALTRIFGKDIGKPSIECGIRIIDCPLEIIPPKLSPKKGMDHDMWLLRMTIEWD